MSDEFKCPLEGYSEFIRMKVVPRCFHCGGDYEEDTKYSCDTFKVYKPVCACLNKPTIRVVVDIE